MRGERSRHRRPTLPWAAAALALVALLVSPARPASAQQEACECKHLDAIRSGWPRSRPCVTTTADQMDDLFEKERPDPAELGLPWRQRRAKLRELLEESDRTIAGDMTR